MVQRSLSTKTKGFTIIEVVLVLAIAGLIFLVVFLALPALQRSQRDTQRKQDLGKFSSQVTAYQSNNQGLLPGDPAPTSALWNAFVSNYLTVSGSSFADPSNGATYAVTYANAAPAAPPVPTAGNILVYTNSKCGGANGVQANAGTRNYAAVIYQEQGAFYCQNN